MNSTGFSLSKNLSESIACSAPSQHISIVVLLCLEFTVGFILNIFSVYVFMCRTPAWKPGTVLQFNLAVSDAILSPLAPFFAVYFTQGGYWPFGSLLCQLKIAVLTVHFYGSILFLTLISVHRYLSVVCHSRYSCMKQKDFVKKLCAGVWLVVLIKGLVCGSLLNATTVGNRTMCFSIHQEEHTQTYFNFNFFLLLPGFLIPFAVSLFCYYRLARSVSGINVCRQKGKLMRRKSRRMVSICLVIFALCFLPMNVARTVIVVVKKFFPGSCGLLLRVETAYYASLVLSSANCCLDPLIYCFASQNFTRAFRSSLRRIGVRLQTVQEDKDNEQDSHLTSHSQGAGANRENTAGSQS